MDIGTQMKAIQVVALGGPAKPHKVNEPQPVKTPVTVEVAQRELVTA